MLEINDSELLMLARENHEEALKYLYQKYSIIITLIICDIMSKYKNQNIEFDELYMIGLYCINDAINTYNENKDANFETYLKTITKRKIYRYIKKMINIKNNEPIKIDVDIYDNSYEPLKNLISNENIKKINEKISNKLSKRETKILYLLIKEYNYQDICFKLSMSKKQLYNAICRIKRKLCENTGNAK